MWRALSSGSLVPQIWFELVVRQVFSLCVCGCVSLLSLSVTALSVTSSKLSSQPQRPKHTRGSGRLQRQLMKGLPKRPAAVHPTCDRVNRERLCCPPRTQRACNLSLWRECRARGGRAAGGPGCCSFDTRSSTNHVQYGERRALLTAAAAPPAAPAWCCRRGPAESAESRELLTVAAAAAAAASNVHSASCESSPPVTHSSRCCAAEPSKQSTERTTSLEPDWGWWTARHVIQTLHDQTLASVLRLHQLLSCAARGSGAPVFQRLAHLWQPCSTTAGGCSMLPPGGSCPALCCCSASGKKPTAPLLLPTTSNSCCEAASKWQHTR